ncbi:hypothetical protein ACVWXU_001460 [Streptomyces sp. TE33382]
MPGRDSVETLQPVGCPFSGPSPGECLSRGALYRGVLRGDLLARPLLCAGSPPQRAIGHGGHSVPTNIRAIRGPYAGHTQASRLRPGRTSRPCPPGQWSREACTTRTQGTYRWLFPRHAMPYAEGSVQLRAALRSLFRAAAPAVSRAVLGSCGEAPGRRVLDHDHPPVRGCGTLAPGRGSQASAAGAPGRSRRPRSGATSRNPPAATSAAVTTHMVGRAPKREAREPPRRAPSGMVL